MRKYKPSDGSPVMSRDQVRGIDQWAINTLGIPGIVLMENAGRNCAELIKGKLAGIENPAVIIFCGTGNNGGDGFVVARHLYNAKINCKVIICGDCGKIKGDAKTNFDIIQKMGVPIETQEIGSPNINAGIGALSKNASLLVDGLFGTGLQGMLSENYTALINAINEQGIPIIAIDIPSGLDCDSGMPLGAAVKAETTVTFVAVKKGFANPASAQYTGQIYVADIGIKPLT
jgi:hydroxyethylthiazole kinase-like uncharacterized protein yjeF